MFLTIAIMAVVIGFFATFSGIMVYKYLKDTKKLEDELENSEDYIDILEEENEDLRVKIVSGNYKEQDLQILEDIENDLDLI